MPNVFDEWKEQIQSASDEGCVVAFGSIMLTQRERVGATPAQLEALITERADIARRALAQQLRERVGI